MHVFYLCPEVLALSPLLFPGRCKYQQGVGSHNIFFLKHCAETSCGVSFRVVQCGVLKYSYVCTYMRQGSAGLVRLSYRALVYFGYTMQFCSLCLHMHSEAYVSELAKKKKKLCFVIVSEGWQALCQLFPSPTSSHTVLDTNVLRLSDSYDLSRTRQELVTIYRIIID
jgi:hypothetical protein